MEEWNKFFETVEKEISSTKCDLLFFRGHNDTKWELTPLIYRVESSKWPDPLNIEQVIHQDFRSNCGPLYNRKLNDWEILFEMRHAGLPTRLLDWTENFASALFFALRGVDWKNNRNDKEKLQPCIWIMNPYELNEKFHKQKNVFEIDHMKIKYDDIIDKEEILIRKKCPGPVAFTVSRQQPRIFAQKSVFTFHALNFGPIEQIFSPCVKKFEIPLDSIENALNYLKLAGVNEYSIFPDLDGLGRFLFEFHKIKKS